MTFAHRLELLAFEMLQSGLIFEANRIFRLSEELACSLNPKRAFVPIHLRLELPATKGQR